jgi:acyl carrier protein phosphodiesterase
LVYMNYLAHLFLAQRNAHSLAGNLMGDFIRDVDISKLPQAVARGIDNHKAVDRFTDNHPVLKSLKTGFSRRRRFAGIIIDVVFDHFLIIHWDKYCDDSRQDYIVYCYDNLLAMKHIMPQRMLQRVQWMVQNDLLNSYARLDGVADALNGISLRMRFDNHLRGAIEEVVSHYEALEKGFLEFFRELCHYVAELNIEAAHVAQYGNIAESGNSLEKLYQLQVR